MEWSCVKQAPLIAKFRKGIKLGVIIKAKVSEQSPDDGPAFLFDTVVVFASSWPETRYPSIRRVGLEMTEEGAVYELRTVVEVNSLGAKRKLRENMANVRPAFFPLFGFTGAQLHFGRFTHHASS